MDRSPKGGIAALLPGQNVQLLPGADMISSTDDAIPHKLPPLSPAKSDVEVWSTSKINPKCTRRLILALTAVLVHPLLFGFGVSQLNSSSFHDDDPSEVVLYPEHSELEWTLAINLWSVGGLIGAFSGGWAADRFGRSQALWKVSSSLTLVAGIVGVLSQGFYSVIVCRSILGLGSGLAMAILPVYISEVSPPQMCGLLGCLTQLQVTFGVMLGSILVFPFATADMWRMQIGGVPIILTALAILGSLVVCETPRWTLLMNNDPIRAKELIALLWDAGEHADLIVDDILSVEKANGDGQAPKSLIKQLKYVLRSPNLKRAFRIGPLLQVTALCSGISATMNYSSSIFSDNGVDDTRIGTLVMNIVNYVATAIALILISRYGRKTLMMISTVGCIAMNSLFTLSLVLDSGNLSIAAIAIHTAFFEFGLGPVPYLVVPEILPQTVRASGAALAMTAQYATALTIGVAFPYWDDALGKASFLPFIIAQAIGLVWMIVDVPETKGKSFADILVELGVISSKNLPLDESLEGILEGSDGQWPSKEARRDSEIGEATLSIGRYTNELEVADAH